MQSTAMAMRPGITEALKQRILILDGATVTMIQRYRLSDADDRGERC